MFAIGSSSSQQKDVVETDATNVNPDLQPPEKSKGTSPTEPHVVSEKLKPDTTNVNTNSQSPEKLKGTSQTEPHVVSEELKNNDSIVEKTNFGSKLLVLTESALNSQMARLKNAPPKPQTEPQNQVQVLDNNVSYVTHILATGHTHAKEDGKACKEEEKEKKEQEEENQSEWESSE